MEILKGHTSPETAYVVDDYPYGFRLRCKIRYWLDCHPKRGFRFVSQTTNPKRGNVWNKPKASTYCRFGGCMYLNGDSHVKWSGLTEYCNGAEAKAWLETYGEGVPEAGQATLRGWVAAKVAYDANGSTTEAREAFSQSCQRVLSTTGRRRARRPIVFISNARRSQRRTQWSPKMKRPSSYVDLLLGRVRRKRLALFVAASMLALTSAANAQVVTDVGIQNAAIVQLGGDFCGYRIKDSYRAAIAFLLRTNGQAFNLYHLNFWKQIEREPVKQNIEKFCADLRTDALARAYEPDSM